MWLELSKERKEMQQTGSGARSWGPWRYCNRQEANSLRQMRTAGKLRANRCQE